MTTTSFGCFRCCCSALVLLWKCTFDLGENWPWASSSKHKRIMNDRSRLFFFFMMAQMICFFLRLLFTIHYSTYNPSRASQFSSVAVSLEHLLLLWPSIKNFFLSFFFNQDETLVFSDCALLRIWLKFKVALTLYDTAWWEKLRKFPDFHYHFSFLYVFEGFILCCCFCLSFKSLRHAWNKSRKKFSFRSTFFQNWVVL